MAKEVFKSVATLLEGVTVECVSRDHKFILDEPPELGGADKGMNPCEALLSALGACKCIVAGAFSKAHGIDIQDLKIEVEGDLDPDGFLGKNKEAKIGFSEIRTTINIKSSSDEDKIKEFIEFVEKTCPIADTLVNTANYTTDVNIEG
ncbi:MAG: OsmC family protein [Clostridiales bacterium]|nr:OsmC family protein [Clostridiales bacterium]